MLTGARRHVQKVVSHSMMNIRILKRMVMNHDHFVIILLGYRESFIVPVYLVGPKVTEGAVGINFRDRSE